ncbi:hypothetical protein [Thalassospira xiamenensis]|uniref:hypothetical protein n=1 Tax=Thalassospira xiamenensis TaxID=220697 RepID=UPI003AA9C5E0
MKRLVRFDPAASIGMPIAIKTIPKNGGGRGRNTHPMNRLITPPPISKDDFKCLARRKSAASSDNDMQYSYYRVPHGPYQKNVQRQFTVKAIAKVSIWVKLQVSPSTQVRF